MPVFKTNDCNAIKKNGKSGENIPHFEKCDKKRSLTIDSEERVEVGERSLIK